MDIDDTLLRKAAPLSWHQTITSIMNNNAAACLDIEK